jgi:hypothetical protein
MVLRGSFFFRIFGVTQEKGVVLSMDHLTKIIRHDLLSDQHSDYLTDPLSNHLSEHFSLSTFSFA